MKVLIVNSLYPPHKIGGAEKSVSLLAQGLARAGDDIVVATLDDRSEPSCTVEDGVVVHRLPLDNSYWPYGDVDVRRSALERLGWHWKNRWNQRAAARVGALIDSEAPDVVHSHVITGFSVAVWSEVKRRNVPLVHTLRDYSVICARSSLFKDGENCLHRCTECVLLTRSGKRASQLVDQLVSNSSYVIDSHQREGYFQGVPARRIFNIVPLTPRARPKRGADEPLIFGFIGRVEAEKGIEIVLAATSRLGGLDWRLRIAGVGESSYVDELRRRYPDPRIEWLGFAQADPFYQSIDVILVSSVWPEPLPRTLIESLSHGLSAICAQAGGIPEIADLARLSISYPPLDDDALARAMREALDSRDNWRKGGTKNVDDLQMFSEAAIVGHNRAAYLDAIAAASSAKANAPADQERRKQGIFGRS